MILHELLTGSTPHQRNSITATIRAVEVEPVPPLRKTRSEVPDSLDAICHKCLEKNPNDRYESAFALSEALNRFLNGTPILAKPAGPLKRFTKWSKRNPIIAASIGITFASLAAGIATSWSMYKNSEQDRIVAIEATYDKSNALNLAETRMQEMDEQMDLLVGIFDKLNGDENGNFSKELLIENLREDLVDASDQIFSSHLYGANWHPVSATVWGNWGSKSTRRRSHRKHWHLDKETNCRSTNCSTWNCTSRFPTHTNLTGSLRPSNPSWIS